MKYKIIKNKTQYKEYCDHLEKLVDSPSKSKEKKEEIALLTLLIETWDKEHDTVNDSDPVELLQFLMENRNLKSKDIAELLDVSKGLVSDILNYKKGFSKGIIRTLAEYFKVSQEAFNRHYKLKSSVNSHLTKRLAYARH